jgi:hypothetical protein
LLFFSVGDDGSIVWEVAEAGEELVFMDSTVFPQQLINVIGRIKNNHEFVITITPLRFDNLSN